MEEEEDRLPSGNLTALPKYANTLIRIHLSPQVEEDNPYPLVAICCWLFGDEAQ